MSFGTLPCRGGRGGGELVDCSRLDVVEIARVPDILPSLFTSWSGYGRISTPFRCCCPWHASELVSFLVRLRTYQHSISLLLKSRASLTCFRASFLPGQATDLSALRLNIVVPDMLPNLFRSWSGYGLISTPSRCCWYRARPWHASELVSFLVRLRIYQHSVSMLSLTCFRPCFLPGQATDLSVLRLGVVEIARIPDMLPS